MRLTPLAAVTVCLLTFAPSPASAQAPAPISDADVRSRLDEYMAGRAAAGFSGVVLVARGGTILLQRGYEDFLAEQLFAPAGMRDTGYSRPKWAATRLARAIGADGKDRGTFGEVAMPKGMPGWHLLGNGGILSTVGDMYRWHKALSVDSILSASAKDKLFHPWVDEGGGSFYGYGWSIEDTPFGKIVTHNGGNPYFFSDFLRFANRDVVVYFSTNSRDRAMRRLARPLAQITYTGRVVDPPALTFTAVSSATAPAPTGSAAARWNLPAGSAAALAARMLDAIGITNESQLRQLGPEVFATSLIGRRGVEGAVELFGRMRGDFGGIPQSGYEEARDASGAVTAVRLRFLPVNQPALLVTLTLEPPASQDRPTRVAAIELEMGN